MDVDPAQDGPRWVTDATMPRGRPGKGAVAPTARVRQVRATRCSTKRSANACPRTAPRPRRPLFFRRAARAAARQQTAAHRRGRPRRR